MSWTTGQLAKAAGVTERYIRRIVREQKIKAERFGRAWMIADDEAQRYLQQRKDKQPTT